MPTSLPNQATEGEGAPTISYLYKASLISSAYQFELTDAGLAWQMGRRSGVWPYADIARIGGERIAILSTTWQTVALMTPQDQDYRAFVVELHRRMQAAGSKASLIGGIGTVTYAMAVAVVVLLAIAMVGLLVRALATSEFTGALFLVGMAIWFAWTIGGFIKRNRPCRYSFDALPATLLP